MDFFKAFYVNWYLFSNLETEIGFGENTAMLPSGHIIMWKLLQYAFYNYCHFQSSKPVSVFVLCCCITNCHRPSDFKQDKSTLCLSISLVPCSRFPWDRSHSVGAGCHFLSSGSSSKFTGFWQIPFLLDVVMRSLFFLAGCQ